MIIIVIRNKKWHIKILMCPCFDTRQFDIYVHIYILRSTYFTSWVIINVLILRSICYFDILTFNISIFRQLNVC